MRFFQFVFPIPEGFVRPSLLSGLECLFTCSHLWLLLVCEGVVRFPNRSESGIIGLRLFPVFPDPPIGGSETDRLGLGIPISCDLKGTPFQNQVAAIDKPLNRICRPFLPVFGQHAVQSIRPSL